MQADDGEAPVVIQTECVDVYLLRPEEPREIELKDFTIMKPKNNKMHRLVRYYPRCEISYRAAPPPAPEEKEVTSPGGTTTTTVVVAERAPRHNGGFSNPSRNAEVFRLKRKLLQEYVASVSSDDREAALFDALITGSRSGSRAVASVSAETKKGNESFSQFSESSTYPPSPRVRRPLPKYEPVTVGDEDDIPLTNERKTRMTLDERVEYVSSLWPSLAPTDEDDEVMDYYGLEVQIVTEEEREKELLAGKVSVNPVSSDAASLPSKTTGTPAASSATSAETQVKTEADAKTRIDGPWSSDSPVKTRSSALQKLKEAEEEGDEDIVTAPIATKQDDWVQCDKCQKWRRLPNHVNVSELPATWYCKMNQWDKRHNKCSAPEEKPVVMVKGEDLSHYLQRKFAQDYLHRIKRLERGMHQYKYTNVHDDDDARKFVQCAECLKLRPLLAGMDPNKVPEPFVCWMNWDEVLASCSAPERPLPPRAKAEPRTNTSHPSTDDVKPKKGGNANSNGASAGSSGQSSKAAGSSSQHVSRGGGAGKGNNKGTSKKAKRKAAAAGKAASVGSSGGNSQKKTKRR